MKRTQKQIKLDSNIDSYQPGMLVEKRGDMTHPPQIVEVTIGSVVRLDRIYVVTKFDGDEWHFLPGTEIRHYIPGNRFSARIAELLETTPLEVLYSEADGDIFPFPSSSINCLWGNGTAEEEKLECEIKLILFTLLQLVDDETFDALAAEAAK